MEYRGVQYNVVQRIDGGFRWSVQLGKQEKFGMLPRRESAILQVKKIIDGYTQLIEKASTATPL